MEPGPHLSVVVPTHNTRELTLRCLRSISGLEDVSHEIILVDDASEDGTIEAVEQSLPAVITRRFDHNVGFSKAANHGLGTALGEVLLVLNSDTEVAPGSLQRLLAACNGDRSLGVAGAELVYPDGSAQWSAGRWPTPAWLFGMTSGLPALLGRIPGYRRLKTPGAGPGRVDWVSGAALALRRTTWEEVGPFDEQYRFYCQDLDLCYAASKAGWRVAVVPGFRVVHHHGATISTQDGAAGFANPALLWSDLLRFTGKHGGRTAARTARRALVAGARLRILARTMSIALVPGPDREQWRRETKALTRAVKTLERV